MVRVIIHGCNGRMGRTVASVAAGAKDIRIVAGVDASPAAEELPFPVCASLAECREEADVLIDFSSPKALEALLDWAGGGTAALILATTGHSPEQKEAISHRSKEVPILVSANMSLGVNLMAELAQKSAAVLGGAFDIEIVEKHHNQKKDAPSGTALALAEGINRALMGAKEYVFGRQGQTGARRPEEIGIHAVRGGTIVGEHQVLFAGKDEVLEIRHSAFSRQIFAAGALEAARFMNGKPPGLYTMKDMVTAGAAAVTNLYVDTEESLVSLYGVPFDSERITEVFRRIGQEGVRVDLISQTAPVGRQVSISFTVPRSEVQKTRALVTELVGVMPGLQVDAAERIAKITVEGVGMETQSGVAARVFQVMSDARVNFHSVSTSETKISCIVDLADADRAVAAFRETFGL